MKAVLVVFAALCIGSALALHVKPLAAQEYQFLFKGWMNQHSKQYESTGELETRYAVWKQNLDAIRKHEANPSRTFTMAMNKFGDLTPAEFKEMYLSYNPINNAFLRSKNTVELNTTGLPDSVDWEKAGKITGVKDQGQCGSCWAFSTTGSTEGAYAVENNADPISLSEQELVDCSQAQGNQGCNGGLMDQGFQFIITNGGLCAESDYPYKAVDGSCASSSCKSVITVAAFTDVPANNEAALQAAVAQQPVSVAVDAETWQFYSGGVMSSACGTSLDHGVLAVGYGTDNGAPYWRVKNSWGAGWGETGFIRLARGSGTTAPGECGIAMVASYPTGVKKVSAKSARKHRLTLH